MKNKHFSAVIKSNLLILNILLCRCHFTKFPWLVTVILAIFLNFCAFTQAMAAVPIDYPGIISEDKSLPGTPSNEPTDYVDELVEWGKQFNIPITTEMAQEAIYKLYNAGFVNDQGIPESPQFSYTDQDGNVTKGVYYDTNMPVWQMMRDFIFLGTMQHSVALWEPGYIGLIGLEGSRVSLVDIEQKAEKIIEEFRAYMEGSSSNNHNPFITAIIGAGNNTIGVKLHDLLTSNSTLDGYIDGRLIYLLDPTEHGFLGKGKFEFGFDKLGGTQLVLDTLINWYGAAGGNPEIKALASTLTGITFDVLAGGLASIVASAKVFYSGIDYMIKNLEDASKGAYLVNYFYLQKQYPDDFKECASSSSFITKQGVFYFSNYTFLVDCLSSDAKNDDLILKKLMNGNYTYDQTIVPKEETTTMPKSITVIVGMADIFLQSLSLNSPNKDEITPLNYLKREVAAFAYVQYLKEHQLIKLPDLTNVKSNEATLKSVEFQWEEDTQQYFLTVEIQLPYYAFASASGDVQVQLAASSQLPLTIWSDDDDTLVWTRTTPEAIIFREDAF